MNIIGISAFYHEASCCLLQDGRLVSAASEERFTRVKHDPRLPVEAFRFCLEDQKIDVTDVDYVAYYESPTKKLARQLWAGVPKGAPADIPWLDVHQPERAIRERLGYDGPILSFEHHESHAASAFFFSGFPDAAILTVDGVGEWATTTYGRGSGSTIELFEEVHFPHSLGLLYSTITSYLGFRVNNSEYKVMGLAPYGKPNYVDQIWELIEVADAGQYSLNLKYFDFINGDRMYSDELIELFGRPPRIPETKVEAFHEDVARSMQYVLEAVLLKKADFLKEKVDSPNLCMAGGVALNIVANGHILKDGPFEKLFVQPAAGDAGGCLGAAVLAHIQLTGNAPPRKRMKHVYLGPSYSANEVAHLVKRMGIPTLDFRDREDDLLQEVAERLSRSQVIAWFHGRMEFGPRALGTRSILANPLDPQMQDRVNKLVKKREAFRPFAPAVLLEHAADHFDLDHPSPYMLEISQVKSELDLPAITHVDGSARPQTVDSESNPRYAKLIETFYRKTGCPILLNTSFNVRGEPIVCNPVDAVLCMGKTEIDALILEDFVIDRKDLPDNWPDVLIEWGGQQEGLLNRDSSVIKENLYTFV